MHYVPEDGVYVYFRYDSRQTVMCIMNTAVSPRNIDISRYAERIKGFSTAQNVITGETLRIGDSIQINGTEMLVLELLK